MLLTVLLLCFSCLMIDSSNAQTDAEKQAELWKADEQLLEYGYAQPSEIAQLMSEDSDTFKKDLRAYQNFAGIKENGKLDDTTLRQMHKKRCGDRDVPAIRSRIRRWTDQGTKWMNGLNMKLRWKLYNDCDDLPRETVLRAMRQAFKLWSDVTNLKFIETTASDPEPEIQVKFLRNIHGDGYPFDGASGKLAHAFYPGDNKGITGDCHFDDDEVYSAFEQPQPGKIDLLWVAVHEIGHSIGLRHSKERDSIMYPYYPGNKGWTSNLQLTSDDVSGIQYVYGQKGQHPDPVDGGWTAYSKQICSKTCGGGRQWLVRYCTNPRPDNGGKSCVGEKYKIVDCNTQACPPVVTDKPVTVKPMCVNKSGDKSCKNWNFCARKPEKYWKFHCYKFCSGCQE